MKDRDNSIFPECYVDTNIIKTLLYLDGVNHKHGCANVMSSMRKGRFADEFAIGIIDDDKRKTYDYGDYNEIKSSGHIRLMKHKDKHHYLIFICKAAEDFLLSCATELQLSMSDFDLPDSLDSLKEVTKNCESDKDPRIKRLVNAVRGSSEMKRLQCILSYLKAKRYAATISELEVAFDSYEIK